LVDGASQDRTADMVRDYAKNHGIVRLLEMPQNRGKGYCVRNGVMNARGRIILFTDADLSSPMEEAPKLLESLEAGADIALDRVGCVANCRRHANLWRGRGWEGPSICCCEWFSA
jgi:glycosyltransferase involved in cell wall biosynthesis